MKQVGIKLDKFSFKQQQMNEQVTRLNNNISDVTALETCTGRKGTSWSNATKRKATGGTVHEVNFDD